MKKIAVLGPKGTYSDIAALKYIKLNKDCEYEIEYYKSIINAIKQIDDNTISVVPFENSLDGFVTESLDQIIFNHLTIRYQLKLSIDFAFVGNSKNIEDIDTVYVQFKAYGQCLDFITANKFKCIKTESNIESLNLALKGAKNVGAIIPMHALNKDDFECVLTHVQDKKNNETRFFVVDNNKKKNEITNDFEASISFTSIKDRPGILYTILKEFYDKHINLKSILSRPDRSMMGKYNFYIEVSSKYEDKDKFLELIKSLKDTDDFKVKVLGIYNIIGE
ncbi:MAG: hypothetical protein K6E20_00755 [Acholeplasmatales bacterium]|nr:hypothetical protein [Acholeplasmatales bacterium]